MTALQAQDYGGALTSVALRTDGGARADVEAALSSGEVVRSWPMRGTLHLVAAHDLAWLLELTAARQAAAAARRRRPLGLHRAAPRLAPGGAGGPAPGWRARGRSDPRAAGGGPRGGTE